MAFTTTATDIKETVMSLGSEKQARIQMRFFKTGKGQYGEGDKFLGVNNPNVRLTVKECWKTTPLGEAVKLVKDEWHEVRLTGLLIMVAQFERALKKGDDDTMEAICKEYIKLHKHINNWDLVDLSVYKIMGNYEVRYSKFDLLDEWVKDGHSLWQRRMAMVACWQHVRAGHYETALYRAKILLNSGEDLLNKAIGWVLRELYKHNGEEITVNFLKENIDAVSGTTLSYACEKMPKDLVAELRNLRK